MIFGDDLAGVIVEVGDKVTGFRVGDAVYGMSMHPRTGSCAEFAAIPQQCISLKPKNLSYSDVVLDATSFQSLFSCACLLKDDGIFVTTVGYANSFLKYLLSKFRPGKQTAKNTQVKANGRDLEALTRYIEQEHVTPIIDGKYPLKEIGK